MDNSAAALFANGVLVAAVEEERLSRIKNDGAFPYLAIEEVLSVAGIKFSDIDQIGVYWKPWKFNSRAFFSLYKMLRSPKTSYSLIGRALEVFGNSKKEDNATSSWRDLFRIKNVLKSRYGNFEAEIKYVDHHITHQLYAEYMREWDQYISLSYDGGGEIDSTQLVAKFDGERKLLTSHKWPNSLGHFYSTFTGFMGFKMLEGEYKMMGLAPYGKPTQKELLLNEILHLKPNGRYKLNTKLCDYHLALKGGFKKKLIDLFGPARINDSEPTQSQIDLATSVQVVFEEVQQHILQLAKNIYPSINKLVVSGGCALNVTANGKLLQSGMFDEVIIPPAPHDAGCAIGSAVAIINEDIDKKSIRSPYLGRNYDNKEIAFIISKYCQKIPNCLDDSELVKRTAQLLAEGNLIAWFQGKSEFGPRALGARSFLADPRRDEIREEMNEKIKKRELFRPFAPSTLESSCSDFFDLEQTSPYMNIVATVKDDRIPAITHVDKTARVHTVCSTENPRYYDLIDAFGKLTGIPVLLNTSFNIQEPIVYSPEDALKTFSISGVDALVIGNYVVTREDLN